MSTVKRRLIGRKGGDAVVSHDVAQWIFWTGAFGALCTAVLVVGLYPMPPVVELLGIIVLQRPTPERGIILIRNEIFPAHQGRPISMLLA